MNTIKLISILCFLCSTLTLNAGGPINSPVPVLPKFFVTKNALQTITATTFTKVTWPTVTFDVGSNFSAGKFTAPTTGYYMFTAEIYTGAATCTKTISLYKNGTRLYDLQSEGVLVGNNGGGSILVSANATDYFEIYVYFGGNADISNDPNKNYFCGMQVL